MWPSPHPRAMYVWLDLCKILKIIIIIIIIVMTPQRVYTMHGLGLMWAIIEAR
jgi:hypothetical protein